MRYIPECSYPIGPSPIEVTLWIYVGIRSTSYDGMQNRECEQYLRVILGCSLLSTSGSIHGVPYVRSKPSKVEGVSDQTLPFKVRGHSSQLQTAPLKRDSTGPGSNHQIPWSSLAAAFLCFKAVCISLSSWKSGWRDRVFDPWLSDGSGVCPMDSAPLFLCQLLQIPFGQYRRRLQCTP